MGWFELNPFEIGRTYRVKRAFVAETRFGEVLIYAGFHHDGDSVVPNWRERDKTLPSLVAPIVHDFGYEHQIRADGKRLTKMEWDYIYHDFCHYSTNPWRRRFSALRLFGLLKWGGPVWRETPDPVPIPISQQLYYGDSKEARQRRLAFPRIVVNEDTRRLEVLPPLAQERADG
jgi:hypothetical protein